MSKLQQPLALVILDGWGVGELSDPYNAIAQGQTPHMTLYQEMYPHTTLACSGEAVGLPEGQMGNSEVGHLNIGAGRIVYQELTRITKAIREGDFYTNPVLNDVMDQVTGTLHVMGLLSDGGVHSHIDHLLALLKMAKQKGLTKVAVHAFLDGRDVPPACAEIYIRQLEEQCTVLGLGRIATLSGRYYAMDRDQRWERVALAYNALTLGEGYAADTAVEGLKAAYERGEKDEFVKPTIIGSPQTIQQGDGIIFFNFRPDRARQLTRVLSDPNFDGFDREVWSQVPMATMTQYDETLSVPVAFKPQILTQTLGQIFSKAGLKQLRIAETEKYAHVTYFFNGGDEQPNEGEERILVPSPKVATYDLQPEMSAQTVTDKVVAEIKSGKFDLIVLNFANGDMVGHTGIFAAAKQAVGVVDECVGRVVEAMRERGGIVAITADHGNADVMVDRETGESYTAHSLNPVPFILVSEKHKNGQLQSGSLCDIAPTLLELAQLAQPVEMTGKSLLK